MKPSIRSEGAKRAEKYTKYSIGQYICQTDTTKEINLEIEWTRYMTVRVVQGLLGLAIEWKPLLRPTLRAIMSGL